MRKTGKIIWGVAFGLLGLSAIAADIAAGYFSEAISIYLGGYGIQFDALNVEQGNTLCQNIEGEGLVLLKNNRDALPLKDLKKINVFGWCGSNAGFIDSGAGSGSSGERGSGNKQTLLDAFASKGIETNPILNSFYSSFSAGRDRGNYWTEAYPFFNLIEPEPSSLESLMGGTRDYSDTACVVIGRLGGEGQDLPHIQKKWKAAEDDSRSYLQLSSEEEGLLSLVKDAGFAHVIVLIDACNTMELGFLDAEWIDAAISVGPCGQSGSLAIVDALLGNVNPSGKTVDTYAYDLQSAASYANCPNCREVNNSKGGEFSYTNGGNYIDYAEGIYVGYKWYETADAEGYWANVANDYGKGYDGVVQYPFGYGLSYSSFDWTLKSVSPASGSVITSDTDITIEVWVTNHSKVAGKAVAELYYEAPYTAGGIEKSAVSLADFAKTGELDPESGKNPSELLTLKLKGSDMKSYDDTDANNNLFKGYELEKGDYTLSLRSDAHHLQAMASPSVTYHVAADERLAKDETTSYPVENRFVGSSSDDGVSIDGSDSGANITYCSRADFDYTFPKRGTARRGKTTAITALGNRWLSKHEDTQDMPSQGVAGNLRLYDTDSNGKTVLNSALVEKLGANYDDPIYESLLNQIKVSELNTLVEGAGYRTSAIASIGKPEFTDLDGPSGLNDTNMTMATKSKWTSFPTEMVLASTWSKKLAYLYGYGVGKEAAETNVAGWYAPACNIHRSPYDGRNFEYYSEDSQLSGVMAEETIQGATNNGLYCYLKHFAVNETENNRGQLYTWLNEQSLRETYLKPFEIAVKKGGCNAIMSSFNRLGATWAGGNFALLNQVLRNEWGFEGSVVTDYCQTAADYMNIDQGLRAGGDIWLNGLRNSIMGGHYDKTSATAVTLARRSAHDVLYTYCNTIYRQSHYQPDEFAKAFATTVGGKAAGSPSKAWLWYFAGGTAFVFLGIGVGVHFVYFHGPKKKAPDDVSQS